MKNMKKASAILLSMTMVLSLPFGNSICFAKEPVEKEETVYVNQKADGSVMEVTVSDWLKNVDGNGKLADASELKDIKNVKGNETFKTEDGKLIWSANNADIYYQGKSEKKLPVGVKISYVLDGKEMSASEIAGESGKLTMTIQYENYCRKEDRIETPFLMTSAIILPVDKFKDVTITQGKMISEGSNQIVLAYGIPGLSESLELSDDLKQEMDKKLSDTVTLTADVKDFSMDSIYTVATADVLKDIELEDDSDINDLENAVDDLVSATDDLISGSDKLSDGLTTLKDNFMRYSIGVKDLDKGASTLKEGVDALADGVSKYTGGVKQITDGASSYVTGTQSLVAGVNSYIEGEKLIDAGAKTLSDGASSFYTETYLPFSNGLTDYFTAIFGENGLAVKANQLNAAINSEDGALAKGFAGTDAYLSASENCCNGALEALQGLKTGENLTDEQKAAIDNVIVALQTANGAADKAKQTNLTVKTAVEQNVKDLNAGVQVLSEKGKTLEGYNTQIASGMKEQLIGGIMALYDGIKSLSLNNKALSEGTKTLAESGTTLTTGIAALSKNTTTLTKSAKQLNKGAADLSKGTNKLNKSTKAVSKGVKELQGGALDLFEGMNEFKTEGTGKLQTEYQENVKAVIDRFKELVDGAEEYRSFSGIADGMDGSVKFIFQTEEISINEK